MAKFAEIVAVWVAGVGVIAFALLVGMWIETVGRLFRCWGGRDV